MQKNKEDTFNQRETWKENNLWLENILANLKECIQIPI